MKVINLDKFDNFENFEKLNLKFGNIFRSEHISISLDKYEVGVKTPVIHKDRPQNGKEILLPFTGKIKITTENESRTFDPENEGLSLVIIDAKTKRHFENIGNKPARLSRFLHHLFN